MIKTFCMLGLICLAALIIELDFFILLPKFGAEHFGAPDDLKKLVKDIPDRSKGETLFGLIIMFLGFTIVVMALIWAGADALKKDFTFSMIFLRFLIILEGYKIFDIVCFDWFILTKLNFLQKLYPQTAGAKGYDSFGFNAVSQVAKAVVFAGISVAVAIILSII